MHAARRLAGGGHAGGRGAGAVQGLARRIADKEERRLVERMYDELLATGTVEKHLAEDDRAVRDLHAQEVLAKRPPQAAGVQGISLQAARAGRHHASPSKRAAAQRVDGSNVVAAAAPRRRRERDDDSADVGRLRQREPPPEGRPHASGWSG